MTCSVGRVHLLRHLDPVVWPTNAAQYILRLPLATKQLVAHEFGFLQYRKVYYFSDNPDYPYVHLVKLSGCPFPLITCCSKVTYDRFLAERRKGKFSDVDLTVFIPAAHDEQIHDL